MKSSNNKTIQDNKIKQHKIHLLLNQNNLLDNIDSVPKVREDRLLIGERFYHIESANIVIYQVD